MYYTEEELLEAVNILVEDYGIDEDEAIEMIAEEVELLDEGLLQGTPFPTRHSIKKSFRASKRAEKLRAKAKKYDAKSDIAYKTAKAHAAKYNEIERRRKERNRKHTLHQFNIK